jgi:two-component system chemotaxis response regulator CheB
VIGASAGGYKVVVDTVSQLPADLSVPVFVVIHISAKHPSYLPEILTKAGYLQAINPQDGSVIEPGYIYVAPPDHHLLIDDSRVAVKKGPKENGFRPSIDALFRSAAYSYGPGAIGVVLSGALNDGTSGLWSIKRLGGIAIVQDPEEAEYPSMPRSALEYIEADYKVRAREIAPLLAQLVREQTEQEPAMGNGMDDEVSRMAKEVQIAAGVNLPEKTIIELGELTSLTCPECHGTLIRIKEGGWFRFRCHTGHGFTADALLEGLLETAGELIWQTQRGFQEASMLLEHLGEHMQENGQSARGQIFLAKAHELSRRASQFQHIAIEHESLSVENIQDQRPAN